MKKIIPKCSHLHTTYFFMKERTGERTKGEEEENNYEK